MKTPTDSELQEAASSMAVANTPLFLMRKLQTDPAVIDVARSNSAEELIAALREEADKIPTSGADHVRPYVYLVALAMSGDIRNLDKISDLGKSGAWDWFDYLRRVLKEATTPTEYGLIRGTTVLHNSITDTHSGGMTIFSPLPAQAKVGA